MNVSVRITNLPQIRAAFNMAPRLMGRYLSEAIKKSTLLVEGQSKIRTPVKTGFLRSSHTTRFEGGGFNFKGIIEPTAKYAMFVHEGTRFMKGRPFLKQGLETSESTIDNLFERAVQSTLDDIGRRV